MSCVGIVAAVDTQVSEKTLIFVVSGGMTS